MCNPTPTVSRLESSFSVSVSVGSITVSVSVSVRAGLKGGRRVVMVTGFFYISLFIIRIFSLSLMNPH